MHRSRGAKLLEAAKAKPPPLAENARQPSDDDGWDRRARDQPRRPAVKDARARREERLERLRTSPAHEPAGAAPPPLLAPRAPLLAPPRALRRRRRRSRGPVRLAAGGGWRGDTSSGNVEEMCFGLEEPVVSASVAPDGSCVLCGFGFGVVRLFDLAASANAHPEDRWGCALGHLGVRDGAAVLVHVEVSSDGKFGFAGARAGGKGVSCWDLESFRKLRETRGFASSTLVATHREADPRLRGLCSVATMASEDRFRSYRLLSGVGYGSMSVWDVVLPEHGSGGEATWSCVFHESAGGPALLGGVLAADGCRALTRVAEKRAAGAPPPKGAKPLLAEVLPLPAKASGETSRSRLRSVSHVHACDGARVAAVHLDDGHVALLRNDDGAATLVPWLTPQGDGISLRASVARTCGAGGRCWACGDCATHWEESARDALRPSYREAERKRKPEDDDVQLIEAPAEKPAAADGPPAKKKTKQAAPASLRSEVRSLRDALAERTAAHEEDLRRADRRFGEEKKLRKAWNAQRADYEARLAAHAQESASAVRAVSGGDDAMDAADLSKVHEALVEALAKNRALTAARAAADALEEERKKQASTCVVCAEAESRVALAPARTPLPDGRGARRRACSASALSASSP
ncbi:Zinc finger protein [Aureococcus anophagefferens]|nr:Zinc finger protein [Aureococcus anophagefferens]